MMHDRFQTLFDGVEEEEYRAFTATLLKILRNVATCRNRRSLVIARRPEADAAIQKLSSTLRIASLHLQ